MAIVDASRRRVIVSCGNVPGIDRLETSQVRRFGAHATGELVSTISALAEVGTLTVVVQGSSVVATPVLPVKNVPPPGGT